MKKFLPILAVVFVCAVWASAQSIWVKGTARIDGTTYNQRIVQTNGGWEDLTFPASSINPAGAAVPATYDIVNPGLIFSGTTDNAISLIAHMPHSKKANTVVYPHIHVESLFTNQANTVWETCHMWRTNGQVGSFELGPVITNTVNFSFNGTSNLIEIIPLGVWTNPPVETVSSIIQIFLHRRGSSEADTNSSPARVLQFDIHYQIDTLGSDQEFSKTSY